MRYLFVIFTLVGCFATAQPDNVLKAWQADVDLRYAGFAYSIRNVADGAIVTEFQSNELFIPASTQKIFCTAAVLAKFGADYRYATQLGYSGVIDAQGTLTGDVIIVGSGDPSLQSVAFYKEELADKWAQELQKKGVKKIMGRVIGDASAFAPHVPSGWLYEDVGNYYGAPTTALNFADNKFSIYLNSGAENAAVTIGKTAPNFLHQKYQLRAKVVASGKRDEAYVYGDPGSFQRTIIGSIPAKRNNYEIEASLPDPALLCAEQLQRALKKLSINCSQQAISRYDKPQAEKLQVFYTHYSPPLAQLVAHANQNSNNLYTEAFRFLLGNGNATDGIAQIKMYSTTMGIDTAALFLEDACGLSRLNACSTNAQCKLLCELAKSVIYIPFYQSLAMAGKSGSFINIGKGTALENNLCGKSGYITRARAYCGYITTKSGKKLAFSVIINNFSCTGSALKPKFENFFKALYDL